MEVESKEEFQLEAAMFVLSMIDDRCFGIASSYNGWMPPGLHVTSPERGGTTKHCHKTAAAVGGCVVNTCILLFLVEVYSIV